MKMMMEAQEEVMGCKDHTQIIKGKRTKRPRLPSPLRLTMATTSSSGGGGEGSSTGGVRIYDYSGGLERAVASPTTSVEFPESTEEEDMANCLILLAQGQSRKVSSSEPVATTNSDKAAAAAAGSYAFQCKTCDRCFPSFQALGGHRASHKKLKANTEEKKLVMVVDEEDVHRFNSTSTTLSLQTAHRVQCNSNNNKAKVHECSICGTEFSSGQALGGHMRRHRTFISSTATTMSVGASSPDQSLEAKKQKNDILQLDLNLPAPEEDQRADSKFSFMSKERVLVFSASSLVDCHY